VATNSASSDASKRFTQAHFPAALLAASDPEMTPWLTELLQDPANRQVIAGDSVLAVAVKFGNAKGLAAILEKKVDVNEAVGGMSPLHTAALWGRSEATRLLLDSGATGRDEALAIAQRRCHEARPNGEADYDACVRVLTM